MRYRILPYKQGSKSAKALAEALGGKVLKVVGSKFFAKDDDLIINWGGCHTEWDIGYSPNGNYDLLDQAKNKLDFFQRMEEHCPDVIPKFWTDKGSIPDDAFPVVCRTLLCGHSGAGIVIAPDKTSLVDAPLYTQYVKKKDEYRVHVGRRGDDIEIIAIQRKAIRHGVQPENWQVRNHHNGFIFVRNSVNPPSLVLDVARQCFQASGLDFGAVDVIYNDKKEKAYVLEINTAPGLEGQTVEDYATFFKGLNND